MSKENIKRIKRVGNSVHVVFDVRHEKEPRRELHVYHNEAAEKILAGDDPANHQSTQQNSFVAPKKKYSRAVELIAGAR
jgi:hypothetical protein